MARGWTTLPIVLAVVAGCRCGGGPQDHGAPPPPAPPAQAPAPATAPAADQGGPPPPRVPEAQALYDRVKGLCPAICKASRELSCARAAECDAICARSVDNTNSRCVSEMQAHADCMARAPASQFECAAAGVASLRPQHCSDTRDAFTRCSAATGRP